MPQGVPLRIPAGWRSRYRRLRRAWSRETV